MLKLWFYFLFELLVLVLIMMLVVAHEGKPIMKNEFSSSLIRGILLCLTQKTLNAVQRVVTEKVINYICIFIVGCQCFWFHYICFLRFWKKIYEILTFGNSFPLLDDFKRRSFLGHNFFYNFYFLLRQKLCAGSCIDICNSAIFLFTCIFHNLYLLINFYLFLFLWVIFLIFMFGLDHDKVL